MHIALIVNSKTCKQAWYGGEEEVRIGVLKQLTFADLNSPIISDL